jgi:hypothetical protein
VISHRTSKAARIVRVKREKFNQVPAWAVLLSLVMAMTRSVKHRAVAALAQLSCAQLVCSLIAFGSGTVLAEDLDRVPVELSWSAPDECPDRSWVLRSIEARLRAPASQLTAAIEAEARVEKRAGDYFLTLQTEQGERQLNATSCEELAGSAALILAFIVEPPQTEPEQQAEPAPAPVSPPPAVDASATAGEPPAADSSRLQLELSGYARAEWLVDIGMLPHAATGPGLAFGFTLADTSVELSAGFLLDNTVSYVTPGGDGQQSLAHLHAFLAQLGLCQRLVQAPDLSVCLSMEHMRISADPDEELQSRSTRRAPVWTALASARAAIPIGTRFAWVLELSVGVPLLGARFRVDGLGVIHETGDVIGRLRTGLELRF